MTRNETMQLWSQDRQGGNAVSNLHPDRHVLSLLSTGSRALPSALPAKPESLRLLLAGSRRTSKELFIWLSEKKGE